MRASWNTPGRPVEAATADVTVIGGGPAGSAAGTVLARAGLSVVVLEKASLPRDKCCGDGLTAGALRLLGQLGLDPSVTGGWQIASRVVIRSPGGRQVSFPFPKGSGAYAAVAERRHLDNALWSLAKDAGARVFERCAVKGMDLRSDRVAVTAEGLGRVHSRYVVAADGMWSPSRRMLGLSPASYRGDWHACRQYFRNVTAQDSETMHVWFEPEILPGYVWSFPLPGGRANVGFGVWRGNHPTGGMGRLWQRLLKRRWIADVLGPGAEAEERPRAWPIPTRLGDLALWAPRVLFCGDAAAAGDPMTGEGIGQALLSGILAAEALISAGPFDVDGVRSRYLTGVERHLLRDFRLACSLRGVLRSPRGADLAVAISGLSPFTRREFARWLFEDYPRALAFTPDRWNSARSSKRPPCRSWKPVSP